MKDIYNQAARTGGGCVVIHSGCHRSVVLVGGRQVAGFSGPRHKQEAYASFLQEVSLRGIPSASDLIQAARDRMWA